MDFRIQNLGRLISVSLIVSCQDWGRPKLISPLDSLSPSRCSLDNPQMPIR